jgi:hypothetical protein
VRRCTPCAVGTSAPAHRRAVGPRSDRLVVALLNTAVLFFGRDELSPEQATKLRRIVASDDPSMTWNELTPENPGPPLLGGDRDAGGAADATDSPHPSTTEPR